MSVKLVAISQPLIDGVQTPEELITYCARVSNPENQHNTETSSRLLKYLIKHHHWSPFEMVSMTLEIKTSRAIAAQILRHRSFSFQEFSQRYSIATEIETIELRKQGKTNRQVGDEPIDIGTYVELKEEIDQAHHNCTTLYNKMIAKGVAKECARMVLPLSTSSRLYMSGTLRSWIHYIELRTKPDTQHEHRTVANECKSIFKSNFPSISEALEF